MKNEEYGIACTEVLEVMNYISREDYNKVPKNVIQVLEKNKNDDIVFLYNPWKDINEQEMSETGRIMLASFFRDYWATPEQREKIKSFQYNKRKITEKEKEEKYNPKTIFKRSTKIAKKPENVGKSNIILYKENIFKKTLNKILELFKR